MIFCQEKQTGHIHSFQVLDNTKMFKLLLRFILTLGLDACYHPTTPLKDSGVGTDSQFATPCTEADFNNDFQNLSSPIELIPISIIIGEEFLQNISLIRLLEQKYRINVIERTLHFGEDIILDDKVTLLFRSSRQFILEMECNNSKTSDSLCALLRKLCRLSLKYNVVWLIVEYPNELELCVSFDRIIFHKHALRNCRLIRTCSNRAQLQQLQEAVKLVQSYVKTLPIELYIRYSFTMDQSASLIHESCLVSARNSSEWNGVPFRS